MVKATVSMKCELCGTTMPESDWAKHKKGKKHRNKVEKSGADMTMVNAAIEKKARSEENENDSDVVMKECDTTETSHESGIPPRDVGVFLRANRVGHPVSDGRTRFLSRQNDSAITCHEYKNKNALWKIDGGHIRCDETGKYLTAAAEARDAHSTRLELSVDAPSDTWSLTPTEGGKLHLTYRGMYLSPVPLSYVDGLAVDLVLHKYPNLEVSSWDIIRKPELSATTLHRGKVKMHSKEAGTGFISCDETFEILQRDVFFEKEIDDDNPCLTHKVVNFTLAIDENKGLPYAPMIELCSKADAQAFVKDLDDKRKLKRYNKSNEGC